MKDTIITYSKALGENHPLLLKFRNAGYQIIEYKDLVAQLTETFETFAVCGTHGKTTITKLIASCLKELGLNYYIGDGSSYFNSTNKYLALEADEYNKHFLSYHPKVVLVSNIEADHLECYRGGLDEILETFETFINKSELAILNIDDVNIQKFKLNTKVLTYGLNPKATCFASNISYLETGIKFDVYFEQKFKGTLKLPFYGKHMIYNILSCLCLGFYYKQDFELLKQGLKDFKHAKRRFAISELKNNIIINDYAHHPSEIKVTIEAIRQKYPHKKLVVIFMPNTYSRTKDLFEDFVSSLSLADKTYLTPIKCDREAQSDYPNISSQLLVNEIYDSELLNIEEITKLNQYSNCVLAFLSCANISEYINEYSCH